MTRSLTSAERALRRAARADPRRRAPAGSRLGEVELAERLGVSRTPVREALTRLAAEGLVEIVPNRGARVATWTVAELEGVFDLRASLEPQLTGFAVPHATGDDVDALDELAQRMLEVGSPGPGRTSTRWCRSTAPSTTGWSRSPATRRSPPRWPRRSTRRSCGATSTPTTRPRCAAASAHHVEIVAAVRAGDPAWAQAVMTAHISNARAVMVRGGPSVDHAAPPADQHEEAS